MSDITGFRMEDVIWTLQNLNLVRYYRGEYQLATSQKAIEEARAPTNPGSPRKHLGERIVFMPERLRWSPPMPEAPLTSRKRSHNSL